ncbi:MAG: hypothetical protein ARM1_0805 [Candidatus Micrarchaeota archaeon]|nr:MAG: hypothetical protein ARM1_0805 [Candidatus Micrarchaeota archaeon]
MTKILTLIVSDDKKKIEIALNFSKNMRSNGHDVRVLFFGPSEAVLANDASIASKVAELSDKPKACVFVAQQNSIEDKLKDKADLIRAGQYIAESLENGYSIISF